MKYNFFYFLIIILVLYISYILCDKKEKRTNSKRDRFCKNPIQYSLFFLLIYFYLFFVNK